MKQYLAVESLLGAHQAIRLLWFAALYKGAVGATILWYKDTFTTLIYHVLNCFCSQYKSEMLSTTPN